MKVIKAENTDAQELTRLTIQSKSYWEYSVEQIENWREDLTITPHYIDKNQVYKLIHNEQLVGFYAYQPVSKTDVKLNFLFVAPASIGKGYGKVLMTDFLQRIKTLAYKKAQLDADPNAEAFYKSQGFRVIGKLKSSIEGRFLPIMEKELTGLHNK